MKYNIDIQYPYYYPNTKNRYREKGSVLLIRLGYQEILPPNEDITIKETKSSYEEKRKELIFDLLCENFTHIIGTNVRLTPYF